jgi:hypothetical protein
MGASLGHEQVLENHRRAGELHVPPPTSASASSSVTTSVYSSKQKGDIMLKAYIANICFKCFRCVIWMLQVFHLDVANVN